MFWLNLLKLGEMSVIHPMRVNDPDLDGEMEDKLDEQIVLPFLRWNFREMIMEPVMI